MRHVSRSIAAIVLSTALASRCLRRRFDIGEWRSASSSAPAELLNVSYDPTRELYAEFNAAFAKYWQAKTGQTVSVQQSHGGSGAQARAVIDGLEADVVTLALAYDIDAIAAGRADQRRLAEAPAAEQRALHLDDRLPRPQGQPEGHQGLERPGQARRRRDHAEPEDVRRRALELPGGVGVRASGRPAATTRRRATFVAQLFRNVPVLDSGARGATTTFVQRGIGDVLLAWENEAYLALAEAKGKVEIVVPSISILAEPPVAVVDKVVDKKGTRAVAEAYLQFLYTPEGQEIAAKHHYRPRDPKVAAKYAGDVREGEAVHDRRGVRRLAERAEDALRRRRHVRSDLQAGRSDSDDGRLSDASRRRRVLPGLPADDGVHGVLPEPHRARPAADAAAADRVASRGTRSGRRSPIRAWSRRTG